jgi:hypothetical protein
MMGDPLAYHAGLWSTHVLGFENAPFHEEWYDAMFEHSRLCIVAPREHAKTQVFSVNATAHHAIYQPGSWQFVFSSTLDQARAVLERVVATVRQAAPVITHHMPRQQSSEVIFGNWSRITVAGAGKAVRGAHPDRIVGDDVLTSETAGTTYQRRKIEEWWFGTVAPMAHGGATRPLGWGRGSSGQLRSYESTKIVLTGTPFHQSDLLMSMRENPIYHFRRYSASFSPQELVEGTWAVEVS